MPYFGWVNVDTVQKTMEQSTQWGVSIPNTFPMRKHLKSRNSPHNIPRRHEPVATDTVFSDTPAVDIGVKQAQVFVGRYNLVTDTYPMKSGKQFINTLEDNIIIENAQSDTFKAPCYCFENAPNTALTIAYTINVSIDCKKNEDLVSLWREIYSIVNQDNKLLGLCYVFLAFTATN